MALAILFFFLGLILVLLEVFFPSFGVLSISAAAAFLACLVFAFQADPFAGITFLIVILVAIPLLLRFAFRLLPDTSIGRRLVLANPTERPDPAPPEAGPLLGREALTLTELRPAGVIEVDGARIDVLTDGAWLERNTRVRVVREEGNRVFVERIESDDREDDRPTRKPRFA